MSCLRTDGLRGSLRGLRGTLAHVAGLGCTRVPPGRFRVLALTWEGRTMGSMTGATVRRVGRHRAGDTTGTIVATVRRYPVAVDPWPGGPVDPWALWLGRV